MKKLLTLTLGSTALIGVSMLETAKAADFEPDPTYIFAATGYVGGGGSWLQRSRPDCELCDFVRGFGDSDLEIAHIIGGGDFVLPLDGNFNVQLGGGFRVDHQNFQFGGGSTTTQFQGSAIGFWRDPTLGTAGIEVGFYSPFGNESGGYQNSLKIGGVLEYFFSDFITVGAFGGALVPLDSTPFGGPGKIIGGKSLDTGFYAGGKGTWYASDTLAFEGHARFLELNESFDGIDFNSSFTQQTLEVGGGVRYLTSVPGLEVFANASYVRCESKRSGGELQVLGGNPVIDGAQVLGGIRVRLGGFTNSLVAIDRSNALDTRAWNCSVGERLESVSDRRLKRDIAKLGKAASGVQLYSWKYLNDPVTTWVGVMAQDLEASYPDALVTGPDGYYRVNYATLGVQMMTLEQWNARKL